MITLYEQTHDSLQSITVQYFAIVLFTFLLICQPPQMTEFLRRRCDRMVGGFTTYAINAYRH